MNYSVISLTIRQPLFRKKNNPAQNIFVSNFTFVLLNSRKNGTKIQDSSLALFTIK